ncbi:cellulose binding domain-containing protein [Micromonospora sp. NPDC093244]|uniref:cellulose binding domain-containing protein n=1 Tax=Micromonospora sp. NPDC093244 TaxID=3155071 RepID=UPI0034455ECE
MFGMRRARRPSRGPVAIASSPWIVVLAGVVVMVVLLIVALGAYRGRSPAPDAGSPPPALPLPAVPSEEPTPTPTGSSSPALLPGLSPRATGVPSSSSAVSRAPTAGVTPTRAATRAAQAPAVGGRYRVVQSFDGGFIGEVLVVNASGVRRGWTVRFEFSGGGRLVTTWVEGVPQGTVRQFDGGFTYVSGVDVPPDGSAALRFHLERASVTPRGCTVDGVRCSGF